MPRPIWHPHAFSQMGQVLESTARTSLCPGRGRDQNRQKADRLGSQQASISAGEREGMGGLTEPTAPTAKLHISSHTISNAEGLLLKQQTCTASFKTPFCNYRSMVSSGLPLI